MSQDDNFTCELVIDLIKWLWHRDMLINANYFMASHLERIIIQYLSWCHWSAPWSFALENNNTVGEAVGTHVLWPKRLVILDPQVYYKN